MNTPLASHLTSVNLTEDEDLVKSSPSLPEEGVRTPKSNSSVLTTSDANSVSLLLESTTLFNLPSVKDETELLLNIFEAELIQSIETIEAPGLDDHEYYQHILHNTVRTDSNKSFKTYCLAGYPLYPMTLEDFRKSPNCLKWLLKHHEYRAILQSGGSPTFDSIDWMDDTEAWKSAYILWKGDSNLFYSSGSWSPADQCEKNALRDQLWYLYELSTDADKPVSLKRRFESRETMVIGYRLLKIICAKTNEDLRPYWPVPPPTFPGARHQQGTEGSKEGQLSSGGLFMSNRPPSPTTINNVVAAVIVEPKYSDSSYILMPPRFPHSTAVTEWGLEVDLNRDSELLGMFEHITQDEFLITTSIPPPLGKNSTIKRDQLCSPTSAS